MKKIDENIKKEILFICKNQPKRIIEMSNKYGISRMTIYNWLKEPVKIDVKIDEPVKIDVKIEYENIINKEVKEINEKLTKNILEIYQNTIFNNRKEHLAEREKLSKLCLDMQNIWGSLSVLLFIDKYGEKIKI